MQKNSVSAVLSDLLGIALGVGLASVGLKAFLLPNGFLDGGVTGVALLASHLLHWDLSVSLMVLSIPFLALAWFTVSKRIVFKSVASILGLVLVLQMDEFPVITDDKVLIAIFGGLCLGLGIGITIKNGAVLDGSEILGIFINDRLGLSIGKVILGFNVVLFTLTAVLVSVEIAMYSILTYLVTAEVTDLVIRGFEDFIGVTIVSRKSEELQQAIIADLGAGVTVYLGRGGYGSRGSLDAVPIIHTIINRIDIRRLYRIADEIDPTAFIVEFDVNSVRGGVLRRYLTRKKNRQGLASGVQPATDLNK